MANILLVEDDPSTQKAVRDCLTHQSHKVETASNVSDAFAFLKSYRYELLILDWDLGDTTLSGVDILKSFRTGGGAAPVLMLTGRAQFQDKEVGFTSGADDYLAKPFDSRELVLRVNALLRRPAEFQNDVLTRGSLVLDIARKTVEANGHKVQLRKMEFALLEHFMRHPQTVMSCEQLLGAVWGSDTDSGELAVRLTIKRLRERLKEPLGADPIETVHGQGYTFTV